MSFGRRYVSLVLLAISIDIASCAGEPPTNEMQQAQNAIDAARTAGAEEYARDEFNGAVDGLKQAYEAADRSDYRLALNDAIDSRERARSAAKQAADLKAGARAEAEHAIATLADTLANARARLTAAQAARAPARRLVASRRSLEGLERSVQEARTALGKDDYSMVASTAPATQKALDALTRELEILARPPARLRR